MQPKLSEAEASPQPRRIVQSSLSSVDESKGSFRIDTPDEASRIVKAPHTPIHSARPSATRIRGERPTPPESAPEQRSNAVPTEKSSARSLPESPLAPLTETSAPTPPFTESSTSESTSKASATQANFDSTATEPISDLDWSSLHVEDLTRVLDQRLFEIERRERAANRRAAQLAQQERMFRLWANDARQELDRKRRELEQFEADLIQRSHDLRWLLVYGDRFESEISPTKKSSISQSGQVPAPFVHPCYSQPQNAGVESATPEYLNQEASLASELEELRFRADERGVRRWTS